MRGLKHWYKGGNSDMQEGYWLEFNYDAEVIQQIKEKIPSSLRAWDEENKRWWVSQYAEKAINDIFPGFIEAVQAQQRLF